MASVRYAFQGACEFLIEDGVMVEFHVRNTQGTQYDAEEFRFFGGGGRGSVQEANVGSSFERSRDSEDVPGGSRSSGTDPATAAGNAEPTCCTLLSGRGPGMGGGYSRLFTGRGLGPIGPPIATPPPIVCEDGGAACGAGSVRVVSDRYCSVQEEKSTSWETLFPIEEADNCIRPISHWCL
jgi:hypothetical protein